MSIDFSVIMPLFNKEKSISSTIESVLSQTYPHFELIIINDGSTDSSLEKAQTFNDPRITIINKTNGGVSSARNLGIEVAKNQFIVFLDADDIWLPYCLAEFCRLIIEFPDAEVFCTSYNMTGRHITGSESVYLIEDYCFASAFYLAKWSIPIILTGCVSVRKSTFNEVGYFNLAITHGEDLDMWERLSKKTKIAKSEKITTIYRTEAENRASLIEEKLKLKAEPIKVKRNEVTSRSQQLFYGIKFVLEFGSFDFSMKNSFPLLGLLKFSDWIIRGLLFMIKIRIFNYSYVSLYSKGG